MKKLLLAILFCVQSALAQSVPPFSIISPANGQLMQYNSTTGTWSNVAASAAVDTTANYTWTGLHTFMGGVAIGGPSSGATFGTTPVSYALRTSVPTGLAAAMEVDYNGTFTSATVGFAIIGALRDTGNTSPGTAHAGGILGFASNTASGQIPLINEMRTDNLGVASTDSGSALFCIANKVGATLTGRTNIGVSVLMESYSDSIGGTPIAQGANIAYQALTPTGGDPTLAFALVGGLTMQIKTGGAITSTAPTDGTKTISFSNNGTDSLISCTNNGQLRINAPASGYMVLNTGLGFAPVSAGASTLGLTSNPWGTIYSNAMPVLSSAAQAANGTVATAMTSLGPAGSHTTVQGWLVVSDGTNTRYIPEF